MTVLTPSLVESTAFFKLLAVFPISFAVFSNPVLTLSKPVALFIPEVKLLAALFKLFSAFVNGLVIPEVKLLAALHYLNYFEHWLTD